MLREVAQSWRDAEASYAPGSEHMEGITKIVEAGVGADLRAAGLSRTWTPRHADQLSRHPAGRGYNFSPGPGVLPTGAMAAAQKEFCDYAGTGMGVLEITNLDASNDHPGVAGVCAGQPHPVQVGAAPAPPPFTATTSPLHHLHLPLLPHLLPLLPQAMMLATEAKLRAALAIPPTYRVLFMHGGAVGQFSAVPLNLIGDKKTIDVVDVGFWSGRARAEAEKYAPGGVGTPCKCTDTIPHPSTWKVNPDAAYVHICLNETVEGLEFLQVMNRPSLLLLSSTTTATSSNPTSSPIPSAAGSGVGRRDAAASRG